MYPEVFAKFAKTREEFGDVEVVPSPAFFYGISKGEEIVFDIEPGKTRIVKFLTVSAPPTAPEWSSSNSTANPAKSK